jgi:uncharacterized membrane protein YoaK (UPF0700 family)
VLIEDARHGPLASMLLGLTVVTGLVDAVSILSLGRVFVANMTGNVVFVAFALAGAPGFSLSASLFALAGFLVGAVIGGRLASALGSHRGRLLCAGTAFEAMCVVVGLVIVAASGMPLHSAAQDGAAGVVAMAMGCQNAVVRALAVPDLTTTVLTLTLTGLVADRGSPWGPVRLRRSLAVVAMFLGGLIGAVLVLHVSPASALAVAAAILLAVAVSTATQNRSERAWHHPAA